MKGSRKRMTWRVGPMTPGRWRSRSQPAVSSCQWCAR